jgi:lipoprotein NlpI
MSCDDIEILNDVGTSLTSEGEYRSAMRVFDRVLELDPANTYALRHRTLAKARFEEVDESAEDS